jgi:hypothetical protein
MAGVASGLLQFKALGTVVVGMLAVAVRRGLPNVANILLFFQNLTECMLSDVSGKVVVLSSFLRIMKT